MPTCLAKPTRIRIKSGRMARAGQCSSNPYRLVPKVEENSQDTSLEVLSRYRSVAVSKKKRVLGESAPITPHVHTRMLRGCSAAPAVNVLVDTCSEKFTLSVLFFFRPKREYLFFFFGFEDVEDLRGVGGRTRGNPNAQSRVSVWDRSDPLVCEGKLFWEEPGSLPLPLPPPRTNFTFSTVTRVLGCFAPSSRSSPRFFFHSINLKSKIFSTHNSPRGVAD